MSYLKKFKRKGASKIKLAIPAGDYSDFKDDDIYVKAIKKTYVIAWMSSLNKFSEVKENEGELLVDLEKVLHTLILMSSCLSDGTMLGDFQSKDDLEALSNIEWDARKALVIKAFEVNKLDVKLIKQLLDMLTDLDSLDLENIRLDEDEEDLKARPKKKAKK